MSLIAQSYFITGTDTNVGKTFATVALMRYFKQQGKIVMAMKPVASGCTVSEKGLRNEDALLLQKHSSLPVDYDLINPYAFEPPVSPHIAAMEAGQDINLAVIDNNYQALKKMTHLVLVEGVGGWLVPLGKNIDVSDLAKSLQLPVILVVAIRLGCINHARLSYEAINSSGLSCAGWIANCIENEMLNQQENIRTITDMISAPLLGVMLYSKNANVNEVSVSFSSL